MPWGVAAAAVGAIGGVAASNKSASAQGDALDQQMAMQQAGSAQYKPYTRAGRRGNRELENLLGISKMPSREKLLAKYKSQYKGNKAGLNEFVDQRLASIKASRQAGEKGFGSLTKAFNPADMYNEPGYQWRFDQGVNALNSNLASRGMLFSGEAGKALTKYGQGFASNEYQNAYNRDAATKNRIYDMYSGVVNRGQSSAAGQASQYNAMGDTYANMGANTASGIMGQANALTGAIGSGMNYWQQAQSVPKQTTQSNPNTWAINDFKV
jgi:hypothetical protein